MSYFIVKQGYVLRMLEDLVFVLPFFVGENSKCVNIGRHCDNVREHSALNRPVPIIITRLVTDYHTKEVTHWIGLLFSDRVERGLKPMACDQNPLSVQIF